MSAQIIQDGNVLWLMVDKIGSPPVWESGVDYKQGDVVVPRFPVVGQEDIMFQVVGFVGTSGSSEPVFTTNAGDTVQDGGVSWTARAKSDSPPKLDPNEFFEISQSVTAV